MKTGCIDFDGVMNLYTGWKGEDELFEPRPGLRKFLATLKEHGFRLVVHSTRPAHKISDWLTRYDLHSFIDEVTDRKPPAMFYLDDRGITFRGNLSQTLQEILSFRTFWEEHR